MSCGGCGERTKARAAAATGAPTATGAAVALDCALRRPIRLRRIAASWGYQRSRPTEIETITRRRIAAPPRIRLDTNRKCQNDIKKLEAWLKEQAIAEAASRGDDWNLMQFQAMKAGKLTTADKDGANLYLFGEEDPIFDSTGAVERSRLTQQNDKEDAQRGIPAKSARFAEQIEKPRFLIVDLRDLRGFHKATPSEIR